MGGDGEAAAKAFMKEKCAQRGICYFSMEDGSGKKKKKENQNMTVAVQSNASNAQLNGASSSMSNQMLMQQLLSQQMQVQQLLSQQNTMSRHGMLLTNYANMPANHQYASNNAYSHASIPSTFAPSYSAQNFGQMAASYQPPSHSYSNSNSNSAMRVEHGQHPYPFLNASQNVMPSSNPMAYGPSHSGHGSVSGNRYNPMAIAQPHVPAPALPSLINFNQQNKEKKQQEQAKKSE